MALIVPGTPGKVVLVPQRRVETAPFTNCAVVDNTRQAIRAGLGFPKRRAWIRTFRDATGIPEVNPDGSTNGTRASDRMAAWHTLAPWYPIEFRGWDTDILFGKLRDDKIDGSLTIQYGLLPDHQRRWSPNFERGHQFGLIGARTTLGHREVRIVDPLGLSPYTGDWMRWNALLDASPTSFAGGQLYLQTIAPGATGMSIGLLPVTLLPPGSKVKMRKGTTTFRFDGAINNLVPRKPLDNARTADVSGTVRCVQYLTDRGPTGQFYQLTGPGALEGTYVRAADGDLQSPPTVPTDCQSEIDTATLPLKQEIARQKQAIVAAQSALEAVA